LAPTHPASNAQSKDRRESFRAVVLKRSATNRWAVFPAPPPRRISPRVLTPASSVSPTRRVSSPWTYLSIHTRSRSQSSGPRRCNLFSRSNRSLHVSRGTRLSGRSVDRILGRCSFTGGSVPGPMLPFLNRGTLKPSVPHCHVLRRCALMGWRGSVSTSPGGQRARRA